MFLLQDNSGLIHRPEGYVVYRFDSPISEALVIDRPNRFIVNVKQNGASRRCHLHDPGRLRELIYPGAKVLVRERSGGSTECAIVAGHNNSRWILTDSGVHSDVASVFMPEGTKKEVKVGKKRLDFLIGDKYVEVKGSTLSINGRSVFPDAPTKRGAEHLKLLRKLRNEGHGAMILVLVFRDDTGCFIPNRDTDPEFSREFYSCLNDGVEIRVLRFRLEGSEIVYSGTLGVCQE